ncbi:MAG: TetR/AcrR family transcriptional regulator [Bacteroidales bacterium]|jgi:AcrR family transcriptional regulator|nr:TetR/AcrR family transcriptional regulator [Bacteroidales bacterium]
MNTSKEAIVNVALKVFGRLGIYKTTMSDIARAAKKGRRTIYQYFKSKEEVYQAVLEKETNNMVMPMQEIVEAKMDSARKLRSYVHERIQAIYRIADKHHAFKVGFIHNDKVILNLRKQFDTIDHGFVKQILKEGVETQRFHIQDIDMTTKNILVGLRGMEISFIKNELDKDCKEQLDHYIDMIFRGVLNK